MNDRIFRVSAYALIREEDWILLCRVSKQVPRWEGYWTLPGGGIEFGETVEAALVREVKEETGLDVTPGTIAKVDSHFSDVDGRPFHGIRLIFHAKVVGGALKHEAEGSTDRCEWHAIDGPTVKLLDLARLGIELVKAPGGGV